ncbi:MAG: accessory gene regulator ArgB-like protein [Saccharofermentanales bacterium]
MIARMSRKVAAVFIDKSIIQSADREIYAYGFEMLFATALNFLTVAVLAIISHTILESSLYCLGFIPMRAVAGGFHAKTHLRCLFILVITFLVFIAIIRNCPAEFINPITQISIAVSSVIVFLFSPIEDENKPLTPDEHQKYRTISRLGIAACSILILLLTVFLKESVILLSVSLGLLSACLSLLAARFRERFIGF